MTTFSRSRGRHRPCQLSTALSSLVRLRLRLIGIGFMLLMAISFVRIIPLIMPNYFWQTHKKYYSSSSFSTSKERRRDALCNKTLLEALFSSSAGAEDANTMRRMIALSPGNNTSCYKQYLPMFVNYTLNRIRHVKRHINLHIPKSGGTSLCQLAKQYSNKNSKFTTGNSGCWEGHFLPLWCNPAFVPGGDREDWLSEADASFCDAMDTTLPTFVMNENYLDHPLCTQQRLYSIVLRDPVDRVMSHERHLLNFERENEEERLQLIRNNYIVWALSSGATTEHGKRLSVVPVREHLEIAKDTLSKFDFLLDLSTLAQNETCYKNMLDLMGLAPNEQTPPGHDMKGIGKGEEIAFSREEYRKMNLLDIELHEYAQRIITHDCEFYSIVKERMDFEK